MIEYILELYEKGLHGKREADVGMGKLDLPEKEERKPLINLNNLFYC